MKKGGILLVGLVLLLVLCGSCNLNQHCPAYVDSTVDIEQHV